MDSARLRKTFRYPSEGSHVDEDECEALDEEGISIAICHLDFPSEMTG